MKQTVLTRIAQGELLHMSLTAIGRSYWYDSPYAEVDPDDVYAMLERGDLVELDDSLFRKPRASQSYRHVIDDLVHRLEQTRVMIGREKVAHDTLSAALTAMGVDHRCEVYVAPRRRIDVLCANGIGIEVKVKGQARAILRQVTAYAESEQVRGVILFTNKALGLPSAIAGKPVRVASMGRAWL